MIQALLHSFTPSFRHFKRIEFTRRCLIIATLTTFNLQCSWAPEVETILHEGPECVISLKTSHALKKAPKHPASLSESLIAKILKGMAISQEEGILQQLLLSTHHPVPAFSPSLIDFLAPHVSLAFSQVTPEEIIHFKCPPTNEQFFPIKGTLAVFSPSSLLLTLENLKPYPGVSPKMKISSQKIQTISLAFSQREVTLSAEEAQAFMTIPSTYHRIAINYQSLESFPPSSKENQLIQSGTQMTPHKTTEVPMTIDSLNFQLRDLKKIVDEQAKEIRRLQDSSAQ